MFMLVCCFVYHLALEPIEAIYIKIYGENDFIKIFLTFRYIIGIFRLKGIEKGSLVSLNQWNMLICVCCTEKQIADGILLHLITSRGSV